MTVCIKCGGTEFESDPTTGESCCIGCGTVSSVSNLVAEVEFVESGSSSKAVGKFVGSNDDPTAQIIKPSQESSVNRVREYMLNIANQISLTAEFVESALSFYRMALHRNLTRARKIENVAVACLYMCCRIERTSHLLVDFTDIVKLDIFTLGKTFLFLSRALSIQLPIIDPCLYIQRYGHKLNLGEQTHTICVTAVKLVSRMKRDWIHHGRRPSGLCGAAILVAARLHGVKRSIKQIVRVVRISSSSLLKRLKDFSNTQTALLTIDEFKDMDLSAESVEADPPAYVKSREQAERLKKLEKHKDWLDPDILQQVSKTQTEIEVYMGIRQAIEVGLEETQRTGKFFKKPPKPKKKKQKVDGSSSKNLQIESTSKRVTRDKATKRKRSEILNDESDEENDDIFSNIEDQFSIIFSQDKQADSEFAENIELDKLATLYPLKEIIKETKSQTNLNTSNVSNKSPFQSNQTNLVIPDTEEINSDFDDYEIENCLLSAVESEYKQKMWETENEEFLKERQRKREEKLKFEMNRRKRKKISMDSNNNSTDNNATKVKENLNMEIVQHIVKNETTNNSSQNTSNLAHSNDTASFEQSSETNLTTDTPAKEPTNTNSPDNIGITKLQGSEIIDRILKTGKHNKRRAKVNLTKALQKNVNTPTK